MNGKKEFTVRPFEKLKKKMASKVTVPAPPPSRQKKKEELTEEDLFSSAMSEVQEIDEFRTISPAHRQRKTPPGREKIDPDRQALAVLHEITDGQRPMPLPDTQEYVEWKNPEYLGDLTRQLHEGQFSVQAFLDLHGYTVAEAEEQLEAFLKEALSRSLRCVKIIHGRGLRSVKGPVIKAGVIRRLSGHFRKHVIAYVTARQCDGGLGALYVLLTKK